VGNIDHFLCLGKLEHTYKSRIRQQYLNVVVPCSCTLKNKTQKKIK
jgi:hypothetical protein